ncbi:Hypothetical protein SRAE_1000211000 [Strongyloides ratti]|uniref:Uncharacterized protein n=1 Tax=Strongyloides ratti TaxID=34506 RepID=A0A090L2D4_STRRB|nr:Hypothetical protein SRAE_1000211000 [Strongyloides ratti]CEF63852.1 Hypothetical protein SRAE_1000211000 [Strongyloides ratti]
MTTFVVYLISLIVYIAHCQTKVENPNLKFLEEPLYDEYANRANNGTTLFGTNKQYDQTSVPNTAPLSDDQQNELNWKKIQADYALNPNPTAGMVFTNNIYGYDYRSNPTDRYTYNGNEEQYTPPPIRRFKRQAIAGSDIYTNTAYANQRLLFDDNSDTLSNYRLYDPQNTGIPTVSPRNIILQDSVNNNNSLMYYPYRTNVTQDNITQVNATNQQILRDQVNSNCETSDPEWCSAYVRITYQGLTTYDKMSKINACAKLKDSLKDSISSCCAAVKGIGCN